MQADGIVLARTSAAIPEAMWQKEQAAMEGNRLQSGTPELVVHRHHREAQILPGQTELLQNRLSVPFEFLSLRRARAIHRNGELLCDRTDGLPHRRILRDMLDAFGKLIGVG